MLFSPTSCFRKKAVGMKQESRGDDVAISSFHGSEGLPRPPKITWRARNDSCAVSFLFVCIRVKNLVEICG